MRAYKDGDNIHSVISHGINVRKPPPNPWSSNFVTTLALHLSIWVDAVVNPP